MATIKQLQEAGNFPPPKLIGAGMKYAKKRHGLDLSTKYKEMPPEAKKLGWRVAHSLWRKEKAAAKAGKKKTVKEADRMARFLNTVNSMHPLSNVQAGAAVRVKGQSGKFTFHKWDDGGNAIVKAENGKKYRTHPLNVSLGEETEPTVLSGGKHKPVDNATHKGKREKIVSGTGGVTQFRVHAKEAVRRSDDFHYQEWPGQKPKKAFNLDRYLENSEKRAKARNRKAAENVPVHTKEGLGDSIAIGEGKALTIAQRLQRGRQIRRIKPKLQRAAKISMSRSPTSGRLWKRSERAARNFLKKRYSPVKGLAYGSLSTTQKIMVDKIVAKKQKTIKKLAKRLLPKVRRQSFQRLANYRANLGRPNRKMNESFEETFNSRPLPQVISGMIGELGDHPMAESLNTLLDLSSGQDSPAVRSLKEKADKAGVPFEEVLQIYADALLKYQTATTKLTAEQFAFNAVNNACANVQKDINENFATILIGNHMMFGSSSVLSKGFGGGGHYGGGGNPPKKRPDKDDENARGIALHTYAKGLHSDKVATAGDDPTRHRYVPNQSLMSKAKHPSRNSQWEAERVDNAHRAAKASFPTEYSVSPRHAITAHFLKNPADRHLEPKVQEYEGHYKAGVATTKRTKGAGAPKRMKEDTQVMFAERFSTKKHDGKRETDSTKVHDIHWKGKNTGHKLIRASTGVTTGADRYKLQTSSGHSSKISMTAANWNKHLTRHFKQHDRKRALRNEAMSEEYEVDTMIAHLMAAVKAPRKETE